ncbi:MAG: cation:proton antiporter [Anaerolineae bacterium]|nr:cation:proton antiporter [Anaerolineae bacterium]
MEDTRSFVPLLIVFSLAFAVPIVLSRIKGLRLPIVVGELAAGILVGRSGFGWVQHHDPVLDLLAEFGFVFLMFLSGMEIDFSSLGAARAGGEDEKGKSKWGPLQLGITSFIATLVLSMGIGLWFVEQGFAENAWMMALILSTTSLGVVVPVLKEKGISGESYGQSLLVAALIADFATMFLITVLVAVASQGLTLDILLVGVLFVVFFLMYRFGLFFFTRLAVVRRTMEELSHATAQIKVRAAFTLMLVFVALSESIGTEVILGAFLAGAIISLLKRAEDADLEEQLNSIGFGFFIPIFFIMVGVDFNLAALSDSPTAVVLAPLLILAAFAVKFIPGLIFRTKFTWRQALGASVILSPRLSLIIAASAIGLRMGIIDEAVNASILIVALVSVATAPTIFNRLIPSREREERRPIIVVGAGELGIQVAEAIHRHKDKVLVVAKNEEQLKRVKARGMEAIVAQADIPDDHLSPHLEQARSLVCVYSDVERTYAVCQQARQRFSIEHVVARVDTPQDMERFEEIGVAPMNAAMDQAALIAMLARNPSLYNILTRTDDDKDVREITLRKRRHFGKRIRDLDLPGDLLIVALKRGGEVLIPTGYTEVERGDKLTLLGKMACIEEAEKMFR